MTESELREAERRYERAAARAEEERLKRNAAVLGARREGWSYGRIAKATGLHRSRVEQIITNTREGQ